MGFGSSSPSQRRGQASAADAQEGQDAPAGDPPADQAGQDAGGGEGAPQAGQADPSAADPSAAPLAGEAVPDDDPNDGPARPTRPPRETPPGAQPYDYLAEQGEAQRAKSLPPLPEGAGEKPTAAGEPADGEGEQPEGSAPA